MKTLKTALLALGLLTLASTAWAAPSPTALLDCSTASNCMNTTDQEVYTTPSVTVSAGTVVILAVALNDGNSPNPADPAIGGTLGATWTQIGSRCGGELAVWLFWATMPSGGSGTITIDADGTQDAAGWFVSEWAGANTTAPIVQNKCGTGSGTALSATFDNAFASSDNRPYAYARFHGVSRTLTEEAGWTDMPNTYNLGAVEGGAFAGEWRNDTTDTSPSMTGSGAAAQWQLYAIEIAVAPAVSAADIFMGNGMSSGGFMD